MLEKVIIIKDIETVRFYTGHYDGYWSRDISDAKEFEHESYMTAHMMRELKNETGAFETIKSMEIVTILKFKK
jgi:hypothetical protein